MHIPGKSEQTTYQPTYQKTGRAVLALLSDAPPPLPVHTRSCKAACVRLSSGPIASKEPAPGDVGLGPSCVGARRTRVVSTICGGLSPSSCGRFVPGELALVGRKPGGFSSGLAAQGEDGTTVKRLPSVGRAGESLHRPSSRLSCPLALDAVNGSGCRQDPSHVVDRADGSYEPGEDNGRPSWPT